MVENSDTSFYTDVICKAPEFHSIKSVRRLELLEPTTRDAVQCILRDMSRLGMPLMVTETYRSKERQVELFKQHATSLKTVGTHHYGLACDFAKLVGGEPSWKGDWSILGGLARKYGLVWGGTWGDADHVQRVKIADQNKLFANNWYPDKDYEAV